MLGRLSALLPFLISMASAAGAAPPQWDTYAGCAAAYQANWQHRLADPGRSHDMSTMIHEQSEDYEKAAIASYEREAAISHDRANERVGAYVAANIERFLAMDAAGTLEAYLECPQLDVSQTN